LEREGLSARVYQPCATVDGLQPRGVDLSIPPKDLEEGVQPEVDGARSQAVRVEGLYPDVPGSEGLPDLDV